ncbi:MAG: PSD1 and planctomycete cytochrome C domain-containing protein [Planctomycetota bacterium]
MALLAAGHFNPNHLTGKDVSFSRDVLPILSDRCFHCHGPDESHREADLRLDLEDSAKEDLGGYAAIVEGSLEKSEIWNRITSDDEFEVMPPPDSHRKPLSEQEREAVRRWIRADAPWGKHWSFETIVRPEIPKTDEHAVDFFVKRKLAQKGLKLGEPAAPRTQLRRLSFDLTGMSPSRDQVREFGTGTEQDWERAIDRIFESPHYAERMAMWWLDAARYSDSDGFQQDQTRQNWPWRDWVIRQFASNQSFKEFTIEQIAGDLLPESTDEQKLATCFHRNHMTNGEGGRDPEESRIHYVIDRTNTTGTVWLGLTLGCVQCHSHKFDPISHEDYYSMAAFFNSIDEDGRAGTKAKPYLSYTSPDVTDRVEELAAFVKVCESDRSAERTLAEERFDSYLRDLTHDAPKDYETWIVPNPTAESTEGTLFEIEDDQTVQTHGPIPRQDDYRVILPIPDSVPRVTGFRIEVFPDQAHVSQRYTRGGDGEFILTSVIAAGRRQGSPAEMQLDITRATASVERPPSEKKEFRRYQKISETLNDDARNGWTTSGVEEIAPRIGVFELAEPWSARNGDRLVLTLKQRSNDGHANIGRFRIAITSELGETVRRTDGQSPIADLLANSLPDDESPMGDESPSQSIRESGLSQELRKRLLEQYLIGDVAYQQMERRFTTAKSQLAELKEQSKARQVMVLSEKENPRQTHVLLRGVWDAKGDVVNRRVLPSVLARPAEETESRLDLANWIVDPENPLTARVAVNHLWQLLFGQGLVRTPEDFGLQGQLPTHPQLLDWLAAEFIESDWNLQHILRIILSSKTYRQSSRTTPGLLEMDPENRLLARAPRFRLPAWMIRDNALQVSGLLNAAVGGPPVKPYQPEGVWSEITMGRFRYQPSLGPAQYRRTVYAFWRRSSAPAFLFDNAQRRVCEVGVRRTNTPLHALTLMNDRTMLEASRALADWAASQCVTKTLVSTTGTTDTESLRRTTLNELAQRILSRDLEKEESGELHRVWSAAMRFYGDRPEKAVQFISVGQQAVPQSDAAASIAAWMTVASLMLNLDEAITRE